MFEKKIRQTIQKQILDAKIDELQGSELRFIPFVGNGLSRIALAHHPDKEDKSFYNLVDKLVSKSPLPPLSHLMARGYSLDEIFRLAINRTKNLKPNIQADFFIDLWKLFKDVKPSPLHKVLASLADAFITTNYDGLIERSLLNMNRYSSKQVFKPSLAKESIGKIFPKFDFDEASKPSVYKIHGSLPSYDDDSILDKDLTDYDLDRWLKSGGPNKVVASADLYDWWSLQCPGKNFRKKFAGPLEIFQDVGNFILILGLSLRSEERIIFRLLQTTVMTEDSYYIAARVLNLTFDSENDVPAIPMEELLKRINVNPGISATSFKREFSTLILLDELVKRKIIKTNPLAYAYLLDTLSSFCKRETPIGQPFSQINPLIVSAGQIAYHTYRGFEDAPGQERAYSPKTASWTPFESGKVDLLDTSEPFGDALIPCFFWDALGIPSALVGRIGFDSEGRIIFDHLLRETQHLDFSNLTQDNNPTEKSTDACWMDLRTKLDGKRFFDYSFNLEDVLPATRQGRIVYVSKPGIKAALKRLQQQDLLIFDTGNNCEVELFKFALSQRSVVISSALSFFIFLETTRRNRTSKRDFIELGNEVFKEYSRGEPPNETGRYYQMAKVLEFLQEFDFDLSQAMAENLQSVEAVACSLGPLGCIWWEKKDFRTSIWTHVSPTRPLSRGEQIAGQCIPFKHVRNGLGCGDVSRAGFAASLAYQAFNHIPFDFPKAFKALVWAGTSRVMFWDIGNYRNWLRQYRNQCLSFLIGRENPIWPDSEKRQVCHEALDQNKNKDRLMKYVHDWREMIFSPTGKPEESRTNEWLNAIGEWRQVRGIVPGQPDKQKTITTGNRMEVGDKNV